MGQKTTFLVLLPYLLNHLEFRAHILTQGRYWAELVPFGGLVHFGLGGSIFETKTTISVHFPYLLNRLELDAHIFTQGRC